MRCLLGLAMEPAPRFGRFHIAPGQPVCSRMTILGADNSAMGLGWAPINAAAKPNTYTGNGGVS